MQVSFVKSVLFCVLAFASIQVSMNCMAGHDEEVYRVLADAVFEKLDETDFEQSFRTRFPQASFSAILALAVQIDELFKPKKKVHQEDEPLLGAIIGRRRLLLKGNIAGIIHDVFRAKKDEPIDISGCYQASYRAMKKAAFDVSNSKWNFFSEEFASEQKGEVSPLAVLILATHIKVCGIRSHKGEFEVLVGETKIQLSGEFGREVLAAFQLIQSFSWR